MLLLTAVALAAPKPTAGEEAKLATGAVAIRPVPASTEAAIAVVGFVDVAASRDDVWAILLDFPGRRPTNPSLVRVEEYQPGTPRNQWWLFTIQKFGSTVTYHNVYTVNAGGGVLAHALDPARTNDLVKNTGVYTLGACAAVSTPCTRLTWEVETDFGRSIPGFVKTWLGRAAVEGFLSDLAVRAAQR